MADTKITPTILVQEALSLLVKEVPALQAITTDFSATQARKGQSVVTRKFALPTVTNFADAATNHEGTDLSVTLDQWKKIHHTFTAEELQGTTRNLPQEAIRKFAAAIASQMVGAVAALYTDSNFPNETEATADKPYESLVDVRKALKGRGVQGDLFGIVNSDTYAEMLKDPTIVSAMNRNTQAISDASLGRVAGFSNIFEYADLPEAAGKGFFGSKESAMLVARAPLDPRELFAGEIPADGRLTYVTEPTTGLTLALVEKVSLSGMSAEVIVSWIYGVAKGDAARGERLVVATP